MSSGTHVIVRRDGSPGRRGRCPPRRCRAGRLSGDDAHAITVLGAGILGLWQAHALARAGHRVRLIEASAEPFAQAASRYGGVMLAPEREAETAPPVLRQLGREGVAAWRALYPQLACAGSLVVAGARDASELDRFARQTQGHERLDGERLHKLEPELAGRFASALYFPDEAHMPAPAALEFMLEEVRRAGVEVIFGADCASPGIATPLSTAAASPPAIASPTCAAFAASA